MTIKINLLPDLEEEFEALKREYGDECRADKVILHDLKVLHKEVHGIIRAIKRYRTSPQEVERHMIENMLDQLERKVANFEQDSEKKERLEQHVELIKKRSVAGIGTLEEVRIKLKRLQAIFAHIKKHSDEVPGEAAANF